MKNSLRAKKLSSGKPALGNESLFTLESSKSVSDDNGDKSGVLTGPINDPSEAGELSKSLIRQ
jgi:hypothetical protein